MQTIQIKEQSWAITGPLNSMPDLQDGFYQHCDCESLDAPNYIAAGSTVANLSKAFIYNGKEIYPDRIAVIGSITPRY